MSGGFGKIIDPVGAMFIHKDAYDKAKDADKPADAPADAAAEATKGPTNESILARTPELETRGQTIGQRASAAGATRSDNEADLLGYVKPKKRSASRELLG